jgi:hypothetical protein
VYVISPGLCGPTHGVPLERVVWLSIRVDRADIYLRVPSLAEKEEARRRGVRISRTAAAAGLDSRKC